MSVLPLNLARVSMRMRTDTLASQVSKTQAQLAEVTNELTTGKRLNRPSDDPGDAAAAAQLQKLLEQRKAFADNLSAASSHLSEVDTTLDGLTDLLRQAQTIASANVGSDVTAEARASAAVVVQSLYDQAISLGNKSFNGTYLFAGDRATDPPFEAVDGGVKFVGSATTLANQMDEHSVKSFMVDGSAVFGATSSQVSGQADLTPAITAGARLIDLRGATNDGVRLGVITVGNGAVTKNIDLTTANTAGDVVTAINAAGVGGVTAALGPAGNLVLSGGPAEDITVADLPGGSAALTLGIRQTNGAGPGVPLAGQSISPTVNELTPLSALKGGAGVDLTSGLKITNGDKTAVVTFGSPPLRVGATVGDMINAINGSGVDVLARVNAAGTGIDIVNPTQGGQMTIGENGGTTAADLGVGSFVGSTPLASLNSGRGVGVVDGDDMSITRSDGSSFNVDLSGAATIADVIARINDADTVGGSLPATLTASLAAAGSGIVLTDSAGGAGQPAVAALNFSTAAVDLGLDAPAAGGVIAGRDVNPIAAQGVFANLAAIRDALQHSDIDGLTKAAEGLQADEDRIVRTRGGNRRAGSGVRKPARSARRPEPGHAGVAVGVAGHRFHQRDFAIRGDPDIAPGGHAGRQPVIESVVDGFPGVTGRRRGQA